MHLQSLYFGCTVGCPYYSHWVITVLEHVRVTSCESQNRWSVSNRDNYWWANKWRFSQEFNGHSSTRIASTRCLQSFASHTSSGQKKVTITPNIHLFSTLRWNFSFSMYMLEISFEHYSMTSTTLNCSPLANWSVEFN